jgi:hypothetical protein
MVGQILEGARTAYREILTAPNYDNRGIRITKWYQVLKYKLLHGIFSS